MSTKTKNTQKATDKLTVAANRAGVVLLTAAVSFGMLELPDQAKRIIVPQQPVPEFVGNSGEETNQGSALRREREETGPHYISYSVTQRTPGRTGRA